LSESLVAALPVAGAAKVVSTAPNPALRRATTSTRRLRRRSSSAA